MNQDVDALSAPAVAYAIHYRYAPGEVNVRNSVQSRLLLWTVSGKGTIVAGGREWPLEEGLVIVVPWNHDVTYRADSADPFFTATVHLIPWLTPDHVVEPMAAHGPDDPLFGDPHRHDVPWPGFEGVTVLRGPSAERVIDLGSRAIEYYASMEHDSRVLRAYGVALVSALLLNRRTTDPLVPAPLSSVLEYVRLHLPRPISREQLAGVAGCSISTIERQFKRYLGTSPQKWIRGERLDLAAYLLSTTTLRVSEVARRVGIYDPLQFSRMFRARHGLPPREYARRKPIR
jgi:AraC-like DNA-binding protein/mannose-6-phosphate isomerase-like protein (cupin superfamily)